MPLPQASSRLAAAILAAGVLAAPGGVRAQEPPALGLPVDCRLGETCFLQQYVDMDAGAGAADPFCGAATYDGHDGTDFRVRSLTEVAAGVDVLAVAAGTVLRGREGEPDALIESEADRARLADRECGNGLIIDHGGGWETQYCHLKQGSVKLAPGTAVAKGEPIGQIGASGMAEFPHVHLTVRRDGKPLDPFSGRLAGSGCEGDATPLWDAAAAAALPPAATALLDMGLADGPITEAPLVAGPAPGTPAADAPAIVLWMWAINLAPGDRIALRLEGPEGLIAENTSDPLDRSKATYVAYAGRKIPPGNGPFTGTVAILRDGQAIIERQKLFP